MGQRHDDTLNVLEAALPDHRALLISDASCYFRAFQSTYLDGAEMFARTSYRWQARLSCDDTKCLHGRRVPCARRKVHHHGP